MTINEWCSECDTMNEFEENDTGIYFCKECGHAMPACSLCDFDRVSCFGCKEDDKCVTINKKRHEQGR